MASVQADAKKVEMVGEAILRHLAERQTEVLYAMLGCCYSLARLSSKFEEISSEQEEKFIQDITQWIEAYWGEGPNKPMN